MMIEEWIDCPHTLRVLHKAGIHTMEALAQLSYDDLLKLHGVGTVIAGNITELIKQYREH